KDLLEETQEEKSITYNTVTFDELKPDTKYELQVYVRTNYGYNLEQGLLIHFETKSKNLGPVDELIVYKKDLNRKSIGLRWSFNDTDVIDGFIVIVIRENINSTNQIIIEPERCVAWPTFYCITIDNLIPNDQYTVKIKAKSLDYPTGGSTSSVVTNFNDGLNIEEISSKDIDKCCESKPDVEIPITEELTSYNCTPGSTYSIGVLSKTLSYYGLTSKIHVTTPPDSAAIIRTIDHNQEVFEGGNTNLRCVLPRASKDELVNLIGSRAILTCNADATAIRDRIKLTWLRCNQLSLSEEHDIIDNNMLVLRNVQKSDQGLYNCIGIESDGAVVFSRPIILRVVEPPRIVLNKTQQFNGITEQDAGRYSCKAVNNIGEDESVAEVLVNGKT
ncbi:Tenascin, partial [Aphis craccivora]